MMWDDFRPLSSQVDWCERNYEYVPIIAEFWNTISNTIFFVIPPILIYLFRQYSQQICSSVNLVWSLLIFVGLGSVYFHSTLSLVGQLIDEIAILWVCFAAFGAWCPSRFLPAIFKTDRRKFQCLVGGLTVLSTCLAMVKPEVNHGLLFFFGVPGSMFLIIELRNCNCPRVKHIGFMSHIWWTMAILCWVADRFFCNMLYVPILHSAWHVLVCLASYMACVCYAYFYAVHEAPEQCPQLKFWPRDRNSWMGIPYVSLLITTAKTKSF